MLGLASDSDSWCFEYLKTEPNQYLTSSGLGSGVENHRESTYRWGDRDYLHAAVGPAARRT